MNCFDKRYKRSRPLLGTFVEITVQGKAPLPDLRRAVGAGFDAIAKIDRLMSFHRTESDLTQINQAPPGQWVTIDIQTMTVLKSALALYRLSEGAFDIRCGQALIKEGLLPLHANAKPQALSLRDEFLEFKKGCVRRTGHWTLDLGGMAKGYAVDCAVRAIQQRKTGCSGTVNAGGDLRTWGPTIPVTTRIDGRESRWMRSFSVGQTALATSSTAYHVRMPRQSLTRRKATATVFAKQCLWADALTKVALLAPRRIVQQCFAEHGARGLVFRSDGMLSTVIAA